LDNVLTVGESDGGEKRAGWPHQHPGGLLEGGGRGCEKKGGGGLR
jgi:hypothetical protein